MLNTLSDIGKTTLEDDISYEECESVILKLKKKQAARPRWPYVRILCAFLEKIRSLASECLQRIARRRDTL